MSTSTPVAGPSSLSDALVALQRKEISSEELVTGLLRAIERWNPVLNAYIHVNSEDALACAREADARRRTGDPAPWLGVPIGIKDNICVRGQPCTCGSEILKSYRSPYDATVSRRLREAGAVFVGRLNLDEFAMGSSTETSAWGPARNPWDVDRVAGGSSGGSAAAVAAGMAVAALGSDTGGSIRQPAAFCGCVGLKPSYGRVSRFGLVAYASSLDQIGPLTRSVRDAALLLSVLAGRDPMDSTSLDVPVPDYLAAVDRAPDHLRGCRIGLPREYFAEGIEPDVEQAVKAAVADVARLGADVVEVSLPHTHYAVAAYYLIATAEASANLARFDGVRYGLRVPSEDVVEQYERTRAEGFGPEVKRRIILGTYALSAGYYDAYYLRAQKVRTLIRRDFERAFQQCDLLLTPVAPTTAFRIGERILDPLTMYLGDIFTVPANLAGICAISIPAGLDSRGLPVGLQLMAPALEEARLLQVAHVLEQTRPRLPRPPLASRASKGSPA